MDKQEDDECSVDDWAQMLRWLRGIARRVAWYEADIDDLVQEAAIALHRVGLVECTSWSAIIAKREMIDWLRLRYGRKGSARARARHSVQVHDGTDEVESTTWRSQRAVVSCPTATHDLHRAEVRATIERLPWNRLTDRELAMWEMRAGGASLASIGEVYGVTESRVCQIIGRTREKLLR